MYVHISISVLELNLDKPGLIQEFVSNPFLLHGHVINIGINVIITSILPLRAYVLDSAWLIRICNEPFHPIDYSDITKYVTDGDHMHRSLFGVSTDLLLVNVTENRDTSLAEVANTPATPSECIVFYHYFYFALMIFLADFTIED